MKPALILVAMLVTCLVPATLCAQGREDTSLEFRLVMSSTLTTSMSPTISLLFIERGINKEKKQLEEEIEDYKQYVLIEHYMMESHADVIDAVMLGEGEALRDLAIILSIPEEDYALWGAQVRRQHEQVISILDLPRGEEQARQLHAVLTRAHVDSHEPAVASITPEEVSP